MNIRGAANFSLSATTLITRAKRAPVRRFSLTGCRFEPAFGEGGIDGVDFGVERHQVDVLCPDRGGGCEIKARSAVNTGAGQDS